MTLLPVFARDVLHVGATGQGLLLSAMGIGALCSSVMIASFGDRVPRINVMLWGVTLYGLIIAAFALSPWFKLSVVLMGLVGVVLLPPTLWRKRSSRPTRHRNFAAAPWRSIT